MQVLDCDFYLFFGHKLFGPTRIGVLYGKKMLLEALPPWQGGGEVIDTVKSTYNQLSFKFEAGTPNIAGAIGLGAALDFINSLDQTRCLQHEQQLINYTQQALQQIPDITVFASETQKSGSNSLVVKGEHNSDIAMLLDAQGIAVRSGTHCAMPLMSSLQCNGTIRVSFSVYNTLEEAKAFIMALQSVIHMLQE